MVKTCFFQDCKVNSLNHPNIVFVPFVKNTVIKRCRRWIVLFGRHVTLDKISRHTYLCSNHFDLNAHLDWKINFDLEPIPYQSVKKVEENLIFGENLTNLASEAKVSYSKSDNIDNNIAKFRNSLTDTDLQREFTYIIESIRNTSRLVL